MRIRTTKTLGQRVDRTYIGKLFAIPLWRRILTAGSLAIVFGWLGLYAVTRNQTPYTAGALTTSHAFLGKHCADCHGEKGGIGIKVADKQCASCHDAPLHNTEQVTVPACIQCHVEHRGEMRLAGATDQGCVACHSNLKTRSGKLNVAAGVDSLSDHPEFRAVAAGTDPVGIKFNHAKHVGDLSQKCGDCHTPQGLAAAGPGKHVLARALMTIPTYAGTCMPCHALNFDDKVSDPAPHEKPEVIHEFVSAALTKYISAHPGDLGKDGTPGNAVAWVKFRVDSDEKQLWGTTCARCHDMQTAGPSGLPVVPPAKVEARWFTRASFDHGAHQGLTCASCHPKAATSTMASDMLLPGIATCQSCHNASRISSGNTCSTCHVYHDWSKEKGVDGKFTIDKMTGLAGRPHA
jgi:hypothetical protein